MTLDSADAASPFAPQRRICDVTDGASPKRDWLSWALTGFGMGCRGRDVPVQAAACLYGDYYRACTVK